MASTILTGTYVTNIVLTDQYTTVASTGVVTVSNEDAIFGNTGTQWSVTNYGQVTDAGTIGTAIHLVGSGEITNGTNALLKGTSAGVMTGVNTSGTAVPGAAGTVNNSGTIQATSTGFNFGIDLGGGGTVTNQASGLITGYGGIDAQSSIATITNSGSVTETGTHGDGVQLLAGGALTNSGNVTAQGASSNAVYFGTSSNTGTLTNYGTIAQLGNGSSFATGVTFNELGTIRNEGTISEQSATGAAVSLGTIGSTLIDGQNGSTSGLITGYQDGVSGSRPGSAPNTIINYGQIQGTETATGGSTIFSFGVIATGTVANFGTILDNAAGQNAVGLQINGNGSVVNGSTADTTALISGGGEGAAFDAGTGSLVNYGTITASATAGNAVNVFNTATVQIANFGVIDSLADNAIVIGSGSTGTITNHGTIESNAASGTVGEAIYLGAGGLINNYGLIKGARPPVGGTASYSAMIIAHNVYATIRNFSTVQPTNVSDGINIDHGGTIVNGSTAATGAAITGSQTAIYAGGHSGTTYSSGAAVFVTNYGTIQSTGTGSGLRLLDGGSVTNAATGLILAAGGSAISTANAAVTVVNHGTIQSTATGTSGQAIYLGGGGTVDNYGLITGGRPPVTGSYTGVISTAIDTATIENFGTISSNNISNAINLLHGGTIINGSTSATGAMITGKQSGIYAGGRNHVAYTSGAATFITNYGTIQSTGNGSAVGMVDGGSVTNGSTADRVATIYSAVRTGVSLQDAAATVVNFGTIDSAAPVTGTAGSGVYVQDGGSITNETGGVIEALRNGVVLGGTVATSGNATLTNFGTITGSAGVYVRPLDAGTNLIVNYGTITGTDGTAVKLTGTATTVVIEPSSVLNGAIAGFVTGDVLDFAGVLGTSASYANGTLTLLNGGGSAVASVGLTGLVTSSQIVVSGDGASGTDVTVLPPTVSSGESLVISGGQAVGQATVQSGGTLEVQSGGVADGAMVSGGSLVVAGGTAVGGTVTSGGSETLQSGGVAVSNSIVGDSTQIVGSGATASDTFVGDPSNAQVAAGGLTVSTVLSDGGQEVLQGVGSHTMVASGGTFTVLSGGLADGTMLSGGFLVVSSGAAVTSSGVSGVVSGAGTVEFIDGGYVIAGNSGLVVSAGSGTNIVNALAGGDTVVGGVGSGAALVFGALGDVVEDALGRPFVTQSGGTSPTIFALSAGAALFYAGADDTLVGGGGTAVAIGAGGDDFVLGGGDDTVNVIPTGESLTLGGGSAIIFGGPGDTIGDGAGTVVTFTSGSNAIVLAGSGDSVLLYSGPGDTLVGGDAASTVIGSANDMLVLGSAADTVNAFPANEVVELGSGQNETVYGGAGDTLEAAGGAAMVTFESGSEGIVFLETAGQDQLYSGPGDTLLIGTGTLNIIGSANNVLTLGSGTDTVNALPPGETVTFGTGNATVFGGDGDTIGDSGGAVVVLTGGTQAIVVEDAGGAVTVNDGAGDTITAGSAAAAINGAQNGSIVLGSASDTVTGANGDTVTTGAGSDPIDFGASHNAGEFLAPGAGTDTGANDTVTNFSQATGDRILESGTAETNTLTSAQSSGGNTTITLSDGSTVTLLGVAAINSSFFG